LFRSGKCTSKKIFVNSKIKLIIFLIGFVWGLPLAAGIMEFSMKLLENIIFNPKCMLAKKIEY